MTPRSCFTKTVRACFVLTPFNPHLSLREVTDVAQGQDQTRTTGQFFTHADNPGVSRYAFDHSADFASVTDGPITGTLRS